jgi:5-methylcytosine-specific restriction endonuclease McrA
MSGDKNRICPRCSEGTLKGTEGWCRKCQRETERIRRAQKGMKPKRLRTDEDCIQHENGLRQCFKCDSWLPITTFRKAIRGWKGFTVYCKPCLKAYQKVKRSPEKQRAYVKAYRDRAGEHWRVLHRSHQRRRKAAMKTTIPASELQKILAIEICTYCQQYVEYNKRTLDHVIPICKGGAHSIDNLVMSCGSCNFKKRDRSVEVFLNELRDFVRSIREGGV